ncbi:nitronate monooxygenase [Halomonas sp. CH40]
MLEQASLAQQLGIDYPIIQAPMAGVSTPALAAAVSNAGGLGSIAIGANSVKKARELIAQTRELTSKPFNVNVFCHQAPRYDAAREAAWLNHLAPLFAEFSATPPSQLDKIYTSFVEDDAALNMLIEEKPAVVSFHFGVPQAAWVEALKAAGIVTLGCATTLDEARKIEAAGVDVIVAQGYEAGGHRGVFDPTKGDARIGTLALVRLLSQQCGIPVIAAGGIMDGQGIAAAMALGAEGVQLGTAFVLCPESAADDAYRRVLKSPQSQHTEVTQSISGRAARGIVNRFHREIDAGLAHHPSAPPPPDYPFTYAAGKALASAAARQGEHGFAAHWAGQGAPLAREMPAEAMINMLIKEWLG